MKRDIVLPALLAGAVLSADGLAAQSSNRGFMLNLHLTGQSLALVGDDRPTDAGGGLGVAVGYGFNERIILLLNVDGASLESDDAVAGTRSEPYDVVTADLGVRMNLGNEGMKTRPYINAAFTGIVQAYEFSAGGADNEVVVSGGGLTIGGGVQYFLSPGFALDLAVQATQAAFTEVTVNDIDEELAEGDAITASRVQLGVTWHP